MAAMHKPRKIYEDTIFHVFFFFFIRDSTDVHNTIHICALLVFAQCYYCACAQRETVSLYMSHYKRQFH